MNYPVTNSILDFFVKDDIDAETFMGRLDQMLIAYPKQANEVAFNLLDSHDTPRLLHIAEGNKDRMKLAALFQLTYMGAPCIYYGDEIGMDGGGDPGCRKPMIWEEDYQDKELFDFYKKLIRLRNDHKALRDGSFRFLSAAKDAKYVAFERADDKDRFIIAMNSDTKQHDVNIEQVGNHSFRDIDAGDRYKAKNGTFTVSVPALSAVILKKQ